MKTPPKRKPTISLSQAKKIASKLVEEKQGRFLPIVNARADLIESSKWFIEFDTANGEEEHFEYLTIMVLVDKASGECEIYPTL